jgi:hypothetical protein
MSPGKTQRVSEPKATTTRNAFKSILNSDRGMLYTVRGSPFPSNMTSSRSSG